MQLIVSISAADILGNWTYILPKNPARGTFVCAFEGFCNLFFFPVGWILTMFLTILFRDLLINGRIYYSRTFIFGISIVVPLLITLLYLSFTQFTVDDDHGYRPCTYGRGGQLYHQVTYDGMIGVCLIVMTLLMFHVLKYEYDNTLRTKQRMYKLVRRILTLYPVALIICWAPHSICILVPACSDSTQAQVYTNLLKIIHGGVVAVIFFCVSKEARLKWTGLLCCKSKPSSEKLVSTSTVSILSEGSLPMDTDLTNIFGGSNVTQEVFGPEFDLNDEFSDGGSAAPARPSSTLRSAVSSVASSVASSVTQLGHR
jgi:hypothetical protein